MGNEIFKKADILLPKAVDDEKWSVVACDQYTSEREYWHEVEKFVSDSPSTLKITVPEIYLEDSDIEERIDKVHEKMQGYVSSGLFEEYSDSLIYVERTLSSGAIRRGIVGCVDLEGYSYEKGSESLIRATEGTVVSRIPPRLAVRREALLETPHIMLLLDDLDKKVIEPLTNEKEAFAELYSFPLMKNSGYLKGYLLPKEKADEVVTKISHFCDQDYFDKKYNVSHKGVLALAVGDGNHSLATAKAYYEELKARLGEKAYSSPARYALCELVNLNDDTLSFEPIHRVLFNVDEGHFMEQLKKAHEIVDGKEAGQTFTLVSSKGSGEYTIKDPSANLTVGSLQNFLDSYLAENKEARIDYVHGDDTTIRLGQQQGNIGLLLPGMLKSDLFKTVILDGALPRKTFSMGHAEDKRFYRECRKIK